MATTKIYTLSLHDALPISGSGGNFQLARANFGRSTCCHAFDVVIGAAQCALDRKSTRLNSSHRCISYAVFCLKKKRVSKNASSMSRSGHHSVNPHPERFAN